MRSLRLAVGLLAMLTIAAFTACSTVQTRPIPKADSILIQAPVFRVGDEWHFTGGVYASVARVTAVEPGQTVIQFVGYTLCDECLYFRDSNLVVTKVLQPDGQLYPDEILGVQFLQFPLRVGKEWEQVIDLRDATGVTYPYRNRFRVEAFEEITVKAGTFRAFRISQAQENVQTQWRGIATSWWSPDVRWWVRFEPLRGTGLSGGGSPRAIELESYGLK
jgi:hypothetical protein